MSSRVSTAWPGDGVDDRQVVAGVREELDLLARVHQAAGLFEPRLRQVEIGLATPRATPPAIV